MSVISDTRIAAHERHRAGAMMLALADNRVDPNLAAKVMHSLLHVPRVDAASELMWLQQQLVFNTVWGDLARADEIAVEAVSFVGTHAVSTFEVCRTIRWASVTRKRAGYVEEGRSLLQHAHDLAQRNALGMEAWAATKHMTDLCLEILDLDAAEQWVALQLALGEVHGDFLGPREAGAAMVRIALLRGDVAKAEEILATHELARFQPGLTRPAYSVACLETEVALSVGRPILETKVPELLRVSESCVSMGGEDLNAASLVRILLLCGQPDRARQYLHLYLSRRRERFAFRQQLSIE
jgi:hypothetical protein